MAGLIAVVAWASLRDSAAVVPAAADPTGTAGGQWFLRPALEHLADAAERRPGVVRAEPIGVSGGGHTLWAVHVAAPDAPVTREVLVVAGLHALEWIGSDVAMALIDEFAARPIPGVSLTVVPFANPDGRLRVEADLDAGIRDRYRRGTRRGGDLNRDGPSNREAKAAWRHLLPARYSTSPGPLSQPETQAIAALAERRSYDAVASLHAFGGYLYHPWAGRWKHPENWAEYTATGRRMEREQGAHAYRTRQLARWGFFFRAHGAEVDAFHDAYGADSWLIEISRSGFARPGDYFVPYRWYNPRDWTRHVRLTLSALRVLLDSPTTAFPSWNLSETRTRARGDR